MIMSGVSFEGDLTRLFLMCESVFTRETEIEPFLRTIIARMFCILCNNTFHTNCCGFLYKTISLDLSVTTFCGRANRN